MKSNDRNSRDPNVEMKYFTNVVRCLCMRCNDAFNGNYEEENTFIALWPSLLAATALIY